MTTDITELALREKFEAWAEEVGAQPWGYLKKQRNPNGGYSVQIYTYMWAAWKAAGAELVESLEKAQETIAFQQGEIKALLSSLESRTVKLPRLKMLEDYLAEVAIEERKQILVGVKLEFHRACVAAGIKVEAE
ncbi:TPA: hypothetical protein RFU30_002136 [Klebsiella quasipneumoniae subsp. quasipneumoniae]|nr:hypothetical protein [Klebsiella quasipneumoniae subsp. quasipneumoniae]